MLDVMTYLAERRTEIGLPSLDFICASPTSPFYDIGTDSIHSPVTEDCFEEAFRELVELQNKLISESGPEPPISEDCCDITSESSIPYTIPCIPLIEYESDNNKEEPADIDEVVFTTQTPSASQVVTSTESSVDEPIVTLEEDPCYTELTCTYLTCVSERIPEIPIFEPNELDETFWLGEEQMMASTIRIYRGREIQQMLLEQRLSMLIGSWYIRTSEERYHLCIEDRIAIFERRKVEHENKCMRIETTVSEMNRMHILEGLEMQMELRWCERIRLRSVAGKEQICMCTENVLSTLLRNRITEIEYIQMDMNYGTCMRLNRMVYGRLLWKSVQYICTTRRHAVVIIQAIVRGHLSRKRFSISFGGLPKQLLLKRLETEHRMHQEFLRYQLQIQWEIDSILHDLDEIDIDDFVFVEDAEGVATTLETSYKENFSLPAEWSYQPEFDAPSIPPDPSSSAVHAEIQEDFPKPQAWAYIRGGNAHGRRRRLSSSSAWK